MKIHSKNPINSITSPGKKRTSTTEKSQLQQTDSPLENSHETIPLLHRALNLHCPATAQIALYLKSKLHQNPPLYPPTPKRQPKNLSTKSSVSLSCARALFFSVPIIGYKECDGEGGEGGQRGPSFFSGGDIGARATVAALSLSAVRNEIINVPRGISRFT